MKLCSVLIWQARSYSTLSLKNFISLDRNSALSKVAEPLTDFGPTWLGALGVARGNTRKVSLGHAKLRLTHQITQSTSDYATLSHKARHSSDSQHSFDIQSNEFLVCSYPCVDPPTAREKWYNYSREVAAVVSLPACVVSGVFGGGFS